MIKHSSFLSGKNSSFTLTKHYGFLIKQLKFIIIALLIKIVYLQEPLLKMKNNSQCIRQVIDIFIKKESCHKLNQSEKSMLAIKLTNCLHMKLGKAQINCSTLSECKIEGDDWNTFTTFFTHIDNLCHFYWDLLYHQRTQKLVEDLSQSAILSENILNKNFESTSQILKMQEGIKVFMNDSLFQNMNFSSTLKSSEIRLQNMTRQIEQFLKELNVSLGQQYSSLISVMEAISKGIEGVSTVQTIMVSEISTMSGILYFLSLFLIILILTSFQSLKKCRAYCFAVLAINIVIEIMCSNYLVLTIGLISIRILFVLLHFIFLVKAFFTPDAKLDSIKNYMDGRLQTKRIKRIFKELMAENMLQNGKQH